MDMDLTPAAPRARRPRPKVVTLTERAAERVREIHKECLAAMEAKMGPEYWVYKP